MRSLLCTLFAFVICAVALAGKYEGTLTKIDGDKATVKVGEDEKTFSITEKTTFAGGKKMPTKESLTKILEKAKKGIPVVVETEGEGAKESITKLTVAFKKKTEKKKDN